MKKNKLIYCFQVLVTVLVFFTLLTPTDSLGFKKYSLFITLIFGIILDRKVLSHYKIIIGLTLSFLLLSIISVFNGTSFGGAVSVLYPIVYIFIGLICIDLDINFEKIFSNILIILSLIIVVSALLDMTHLVEIFSNPLVNYISNLGEGQISISSDAIFHYVIFLNGSPLILYNVSKFGFQKYYAGLILSVLALFFSGTRANIYMAIVIVVIIVLIKNKNILLKILLFLTASIFYEFFQIKNNSINQAKSGGDFAREMKLEVIKSELGNSGQTWFFGKGLGSYYYGPVTRVFNTLQYGYINTSEWSYMEVIRQTGLLGLVIFMTIICMPILKLSKKKNYYPVLGGAAYLIVAIVDPFLITSTGFILYSVLYYLNYRKV